MRVERFPRLALMVVLLGIAIYSAASESLIIVVLALPIALLAWWMSESKDARPLPKWIVGLFILIALLNAARSVLADGIDIEDFCEFVILVQLAKLFERKLARDYAQLLTLSAFLTIGSMLTSVALLPSVLMFVLIPMLVVAAARFQVYAGTEGVQRWTASIAPGEVPTVAIATGRRARLHAALLAVGMLVSGLVISTVVFMLVPRGVGESMFGSWASSRGRTVTGFSDTVRLGGQGVISSSSVIVLDLRVFDENDQPIGGPNEVFYLRGVVLDRYLGEGKWDRSPLLESVPAKPRLDPGREIRLGDRDNSTINLKQEITLRRTPLTDGYIFASWKPIRVTFNAGTVIYNTLDRTMRWRGESGKFKYEVQSARQIRLPPLRGRERTATSFESPRLAELARAILAEVRIEPDPAVRPMGRDALAARTIENYLRTEYVYSLEQRRPAPGVDPIEWFVFDERIGHCEYFASAMIALCRTVGINTRLVTGYVAAEWNTSSKHYTVRQSNAHAWVEAEIRPGVWRTYDPTPPGDLSSIHRPKAGLIARIGRFFDSLEYAWINTVVGFDEHRRSSLFGAISPGGGQLRDPSDLVAGKPISLVDRWLRAIIQGGLAFLIVAAGGLLGRELIARLSWRTRPGTDPLAFNDDPELIACLAEASFYEEMLDRLGRLGLAKPDTIPPLAHARMLGVGDPSLGAPVIRLTRLYYRLRFGRLRLTRTQNDQIHRDLGLLRQHHPPPDGR